MTPRRMCECLENTLQLIEFVMASSNGRCGRFITMFS